MRTLFITHHYLSSPGGGTFASRAYINAFAELSDEMTLLYPVKEGEDTFEGIHPKIQGCPVAYNASRWQKGLNILKGKVHRYGDIAHDYLASGHFDVVVFDNSKTSFRLIDEAHRYGLRVVVIHHNYEYEYVRDNSPAILRPIDLFWIERVEREAVQKADLNMVLSRQDMTLLSKAFLNGRTDSFALLGVFEYESRPSQPLHETRPAENHFIITGNLSAVQTKQSLIPWLNTYFPILTEVVPEAHLTIAGKNPDNALTQLCKERGIELIPSPVSMAPYLQKAACYICPVDLGGGVKLRVMDGLKNGLPVIAHKVSARGYDQFVEQGCLLPYSDPQSFRQALEQYKHLALKRKDILHTYQRLFTFQAGVDNLRNILTAKLHNHEKSSNIGISL